MSPPPTLDIEELERRHKQRSPIQMEYGELFLNNRFSWADVMELLVLRRDAPALIAAARRDAERRTRGELVEALNEQAEAQRSTIANLREALKAAEEFVAEQTEGAEMFSVEPDEIDRHRSCLALIRSALGTDGESK